MYLDHFGLRESPFGITPNPDFFFEGNMRGELLEETIKARRELPALSDSAWAALVQAPSGATLLAAGQKVELTGRGLEGIRLELQAPQDQAVNLGTLQGDAVAIFAGQLKHSGMIQATGISAEGGKVVLKAQDTADISGQIGAVHSHGHRYSLCILHHLIFQASKIRRKKVNGRGIRLA